MPDPNPKPKPVKRRFFLCTGKCVDYEDLHRYPQSHILGELRYLTDEGRQVTSLALYETSVRADQVPPLKPAIRVYLIGDARMIKCGFPACENIQRWEIGKAAFEQLMKRYAPPEPTAEQESLCAECGHSKARHETAGGFCKHCPCNEFKYTNEHVVALPTEGHSTRCPHCASTDENHPVWCPNNNY